MQLIAPANVQIKNVVLPPPPKNPFEDRYDRLPPNEVYISIVEVTQAVLAVEGFKRPCRFLNSRIITTCQALRIRDRLLDFFGQILDF
jgi:hypothetical protein